MTRLRSLEDAPMLRNGEMHDEEEAAMPLSLPLPKRRPPGCNRIHIIMWRIIWVLAAMSVTVILVFAPWPSQQQTTDSQSPAEHHQHLPQHGGAPQLHGNNKITSHCRNSTLDRGCRFDATQYGDREHYLPVEGH